VILESGLQLLQIGKLVEGGLRASTWLGLGLAIGGR